MNDPTTPAEDGCEIAVANSVHSFVKSLSINPERQIASVRGLISDLMYSRIEAVTAIGGGGGVGGGRTEVPVDPLGGGLS